MLSWLLALFGIKPSFDSIVKPLDRIQRDLAVLCDVNTAKRVENDTQIEKLRNENDVLVADSAKAREVIRRVQDIINPGQAVHVE